MINATFRQAAVFGKKVAPAAVHTVPHWLDVVIEGQAYHYGVTPMKFAALMHDAASYQELIDTHQVDEQ